MATTSRYSTSAVRDQLSECTKGPPLLTHSLAFITKLQTDNTASSVDSTSDLLAEGLCIELEVWHSKLTDS